MPFTRENAAECARKSHEPDSARFLPKPEKIPAPIIEESCTDDALHDAEKFRHEAKLRTREQFRKLQDKIDDVLDRRELDVKAMRDLADASLKLESVEQRLSGRPLPGTLKPSSAPTKRRQTFAEPIPLSEPGPQVQEAKTCDPFSEVGMPENG